MEFKYIKETLYVNTDMGCWKPVYSSGMEQIALYHRNSRQAPLDFKISSAKRSALFQEYCLGTTVYL